MSSVVSSLSDLANSLIQVVWSFFTTAGDLVQNTLQFVVKFASEILGVIGNFFQGLIELAGGIVQFVVGNVLMLGVLAAAFFGFLQYQRNQGKPVKVGDKKLN